MEGEKHGGGRPSSAAPRCQTTKTDMLTIDGSFGEGGGQIIRSSLALSLVTGKPFVIDRVRAGRKKPGLRQQHLTAVRAAAEIGKAEVGGAAIGSQRLTFRPGAVTPGDYLADQLLLPLGIGAWQGTGGGTFRTLGLSTHVKTHLEILAEFLDIRSETIQRGHDDWHIRIAPA